MIQHIVRLPFDYEMPEEPAFQWAGKVVGSEEYAMTEIHLVMGDLPDDMDVLATEGEPINQELILPYMSDVPLIGYDGEMIAYEPVTDITDKLQTFAGHSWTY